MKERNFTLPPNWIETELGGLFILIRNGLVVEQYKEPIGIPISRIETISNGFINFEKVRYVRKIDQNKKQQYLLQQGDILFSHINSDLHLGKTAIFNCSQELLHGMNLLLLRVPKDLVDPYYVNYFLNFSRMSGDFIAIAQHAVNQSSLNQRKINSFRIRLAPLNEQKRIVDKIELLFSDLDGGEALLKTVQKQLATYRQSVLKAAVTGELTKDWREQNKHRLEPGEKLLERILKSRSENWKGRGKYKEPEEPKNIIFVDIPNSWSVATIDQISSIVEYGSSAKCSTENLGVPVVRMGNIQDGKLDLGDLKYLPENHDEFPKLLLEFGDLLFNRTNSAELVGKTAVYMGRPEKCSFASYLIRVKLINTAPMFISAYINSVFGRAWIQSVVSQQVGQANVNGSKLKSLSIPLPSREEQEEIVQRLDDIFSQIDALENWCATELERSTTLRQSILKAAFSGKLVPQDPNDEPASELLKRIQANRAAQPKASNTRLHKKRISKTEVA